MHSNQTQGLSRFNLFPIEPRAVVANLQDDLIYFSFQPGFDAGSVCVARHVGK